MNIDFKEVIVCPRCLCDKLSYSDRHIQCTKCSSEYMLRNGIPYFTDINNDIKPKQSQDIRNHKNWTSWRKQNFSFFRNYLCDINANDEILDLGAGQGHFRDLFGGYRYIAIDFYPYKGIDIVSDLSAKLPIKTSFFDYIILSNVLEHIKDPLNLLKESNRVLKKGGRLLMTVPFIIKIHQSPYDFNRYTHYMLQYLLGEAGFETVDISKIGNIVELYRTIRRSFYKQAVRPKLIWKLFSKLYKITDFIYDKLLLDRNIKNDKERDYFIGYSCVAIKNQNI